MSLIDPMKGPGGVRAVAARWVVTGEIVLETACHLGGEPEGAIDMALLRDALEGGPLLTGTSLAGAMRSHLADYLQGYESAEHAEVAKLFGGERGDDAGGQSPLVVFDSLGLLPKDRSIEVRDGVAIDAASGTAEDHKKYDFEVLPPGTVFPVRLELVIAERKQEARLLSLLATALSGLARDEICLGARRSRGLGCLATRNWRARRFGLDSAAGWTDWLCREPRRPLGDDERGCATIREAIGQALNRAGRGERLEDITDSRERAIIQAKLVGAGTLLVRSPARTVDAPDVVQVSSAGRPVLPGTSVAGVIRVQALKIARWVRPGADAAEWVNRLFGPRPAEPDRDEAPLWASRLRVSERVVDGCPIRPSRIRVDRLTHGVASGGLFDEEPVQGPAVEVRLELRKPQPGELGLVMLVLKDLLSGRVVVGGDGSIGRGILAGSATLEAPGHSTPIVLDPEKPLAGDDLAFIDAAIRSFRDTTWQEGSP